MCILARYEWWLDVINTYFALNGPISNRVVDGLDKRATDANLIVHM
jgi:hypothetical protein